MNNDFEELCKSLKKNPMYYFSLASKELFHSNFIAWLYEENKIQSFIEDFLKSKGKINDDDKLEFESIHRELNNFDIVFQCKINSIETNIIIENKVKSYPSVDQLVKYEDRAKEFNCDCIFILLTLDYSNHGRQSIWNTLLYSDFIKYIEDNLLNKDDCKERYLSDYIELVKGLQSILENFNREDTFLCTNDERVALKEIKLYDFIAKRQFEKLRSSLLEQYNDGKVKTSTDFIKGEPIIDVYIEINGIKIGTQVNGLNYRHFVIEPMLTRGCVAYSLEKIWFDGLPVPRRNSKRINEYGFGEFKDKKNKQLFLHRSCAINPNMERKELAEQIKMDVDYLLENKKDLANKIKKITHQNPS